MKLLTISIVIENGLWEISLLWIWIPPSHPTLMMYDFELRRREGGSVCLTDIVQTEDSHGHCFVLFVTNSK
jgi:hypothetical protein